MSEVLRAILDHNCIDSRPAFYAANITLIEPATAFAIGRRQTSITCKADTYFLVMGAAQDNGVFTVGAQYSWELPAFPTTFQIVRGNTGESFSISPQQAVLQNYNLNNFVTLDEYILFDPAEIITFNMDMRTASVAALTAFSFVTLAGIEYQMPEGMRLPNYG